MGRTRTLLGLALIVIGTILLSRALMQPAMPELPPLPDLPDPPSIPAMTDLPPLPAMPDLPPLPAIPPLPAMPDLPSPPPLPPLPEHAPFFHSGAWFNPAILVLVLLLAIVWLRRRGTRERPLA